MSHHVSATASNPTGAVEVVRVPSSSTTAAPVDPGSAAGSAGAVAPAAAPTSVSTPVSSVVSGATPTAGQSGTPGANLPVDTIEQASNTIQNAQADLSRTAGAERRLDGFDLVGGGGGGGGGEAEAGQENANNAEGAVAQGTADQDVSETGIGGDRDAVGQQADLSTSLDQDGNVVGEANNANDVQQVSGTGQQGTGTGLPDTDERSQALA